ncbi:MAG: GPW/gp25 family protein [bacterium]
MDSKNNLKDKEKFSKEFLGKGWSFPSMLKEGRLSLSEMEEDIREAILIILGTSKGERIMRPEFGCGIHEMVFLPLNETTRGLIRYHVEDALTRWEPRIELLKVSVDFDRREQGKVLVGIEYKVRSTNTRENLVYPFYLTEG